MGFTEPKIVAMDRLVLAGFNFFGDPFAASAEWTEENEIGRTWHRFMAYLNEDPTRSGNLFVRDVAYEVHLYNADTVAKGNFDIFVGMEVVRMESVRFDLLVRVLPASTYAVFTLNGDEIASDWHKPIYDEWLPRSGYEEAHTYQIQYYDHRFKGMDQLKDSELDIYIPITKK